MKLRIPPALVMLVFAGLMYLLAKFLPVGYFDFAGREWGYKILVGLAVLVFLASFFKFKIAKTTVDPINPEKASTLVTSGIYKFTRNPMYLGMLLLLLAFATRLGNAFNVLLAAGFVSYINKFQIKNEEAALTILFGKEYKVYCNKVRRWF